MAGHPMAGHKRGVHVLTAMKALSPLLHESFVEIWDTVIPRLIQYVEGKTVLKVKLVSERCEKCLLFLEYPYPVHAFPLPSVSQIFIIPIQYNKSTSWQST